MKKTLISLAFGLMALGVFADEIYVSPDGDDAANGQKETPYRTIRKAIEDATPGTTIYLRGGRYMPTEADVMYRGAEKVYDCVYYLDKNGRAGSPITLGGYPGEDVVIDLSQVRPDARVMGFNVNGDYWHLRDFDIVGIQVTQTGHTQSINVGLFGGSNCVIERVNMHDGMGIGVYATKGSNNLVLNCDAYNNYDPVSEGGYGGNCDGFGFHLNGRNYIGNRLYGCRAWRNSDDGFDLINNNSPVTIENCWAWENGYDADLVSRGDGTGFKSGGFGMKTVKAGTVAPRNVVTNCIAWSNKQNGFYANHHLGGLDFKNCSSYQNKRNFNMVNRKSIDEAVDVPGYAHHLSDNLSYRPELSDADCVNINTSLCTLENNTFLPSVAVGEADFESLDASQLLRPRKADGSLPNLTFMRLRADSPLYGRGVGYLFGESTSGMVSVEAQGNDAKYYNLMGVCVEHPADGIFICSGQKVYVP